MISESYEVQKQAYLDVLQAEVLKQADELGIPAELLESPDKREFRDTFWYMEG